MAKRKRAGGKKEAAARSLMQMDADTGAFIKKFWKDIEVKIEDYKSYACEFNKTNMHSRAAKRLKKQD
ncbi:hypothetical protein HYY74_07200 [Candidatus Woesearchaeota archaeon]|nr:hypothetical protein [Candidatus Woesearchaeota archaeon]